MMTQFLTAAAKLVSIVGLCLGWGWAANAQQTLVVGLVPSEDGEAMVRESAPLLNKLSQLLGMRIKPFVATDYGSVIEAMRGGHVDVGWFGGFSYVIASSVAGADAFAVPVPAKTGIASYRSCIFVRADSPYKTLADVKGKTLALVDPTSSSGNLFPRAFWRRTGLNRPNSTSRAWSTAAVTMRRFWR